MATFICAAISKAARLSIMECMICLCVGGGEGGGGGEREGEREGENACGTF